MCRSKTTASSRCHGTAKSSGSGKPAITSTSSATRPKHERRSKRRPNVKPPRGSFDWLHMNSADYVGPNQWFDQGDTRFAPNNIIISSRESSVLAIVGRDGTIVLAARSRFQPVEGASRDRSDHRAASCASHSERPAGRGQSAGVRQRRLRAAMARTSAIAPEGRGTYARAELAGAGDQPGDARAGVVLSKPGFFSTNISSAQRLPNGNTLITAGADGRMFEVTREGDDRLGVHQSAVCRRELIERRVPRLSHAVCVDPAAGSIEPKTCDPAGPGRLQSALISRAAHQAGP